MPNERRRSSRKARIEARLRLHAPDPVERVLQLEEGARRGQQEGDRAQDSGQRAALFPPSPLEQRLHGLRPFGPHQLIYLRHDLAPDSLLAEREPRDGDHDEKDGCQ